MDDAIRVLTSADLPPNYPGCWAGGHDWATFDPSNFDWRAFVLTDDVIRVLTSADLPPNYRAVWAVRALIITSAAVPTIRTSTTSAALISTTPTSKRTLSGATAHRQTLPMLPPPRSPNLQRNHPDPPPLRLSAGTATPTTAQPGWLTEITPKKPPAMPAAFSTKQIR